MLQNPKKRIFSNNLESSEVFKKYTTSVKKKQHKILDFLRFPLDSNRWNVENITDIQPPVPMTEPCGVTMRKDPSKAKGRPVQAGTTLKKLLKDLGVDFILKRHHLWTCWEKVVGEKIAAHTHPDFISGKSLFIIVDHPTWMHQLNFLKEQLILNINREINTQPISEIRFRLGILPDRTAPKPQKTEGVFHISPEDYRRMETSLQKIASPDLRETVRRVMLRDLNKS